MSESAFSASYEEARSKFLEASRAFGGRVESFAHPQPGPDGRPVYCDIAWHGSRRPEKLLVTISATHGVEGFCGSGAQVAWLVEREPLPADTALLQLHAINPQGYAWLRRVTEENVDLNRNFVDFANPPRNPGYEELHPILCPTTWHEGTAEEMQRGLDAYRAAHGMDQLRTAMIKGQYKYADGIFFGGSEASWSHRLLKDIIAEHCAGVRLAFVVDYHTGLGPRGQGERFCDNLPGTVGWELAERWFDKDLTSSHIDPSLSQVLHGINYDGILEAAGDTLVIMVALEFGTLPLPQVRLALTADNWLHRFGKVDSALGQAIKAQIREAFYGDDPAWKSDVLRRSFETQRLALRGLAGS